MDVSILQHAKDQRPRQMPLGEVVEMMRGGEWPVGYGPLLVAGAVVEGGRQRKHVRWLTGLGAVRIRVGEASGLDRLRGDPHSLLCWRGGDGCCWVVYQYELNDGYRRDTQLRWYGRVFHLACDYYEQVSGGEADRTTVGATYAVPLCRDVDAAYDAGAMPFLSSDVGAGSGGRGGGGLGGRGGLGGFGGGGGFGGRGGKATNSDIKRFLDDHILLRRNVVTGRVEYRLAGSGEWRLMDDVRQNTLWDELSAEQAVDYRDLDRIINSDYTPAYHPFRSYLESLPPWDGESNAILALSATVQVRGGYDEQMLFYEYLKKWLVGMVAGWVDDEEVNQSILVLLGRQGIYKTTWFSYLLPPELRQYFYTKTNSQAMTKDDRLVLAQYGLICCEELDTMKPSEMNQLKSLMTARFLDERAAYARYHEHRKHIASFCGTGNNMQFLNDPSGTRRWLPFEVESITSPRDLPPDYEGIYSQAYGLYRRGFPYYFTEAETERLMRHNEQFETSDSASELIEEYFRKPRDGESCEFVRTSVAAQMMSSPGLRVTAVEVGRAFSQLGYERVKHNGSRGFMVVRLLPEERRMRSLAVAYDEQHGGAPPGQMDR